MAGLWHVAGNTVMELTMQQKYWHVFTAPAIWVMHLARLLFWLQLKTQLHCHMKNI